MGDLNFLVLNIHTIKRTDNNKSDKLKQPKDLIKPSDIHLLDENNTMINDGALAVAGKKRPCLPKSV